MKFLVMRLMLNSMSSYGMVDVVNLVMLVSV